MTALAWIVVAKFDTQQQAKQAAEMLTSMAPSAYHFSAVDRLGDCVWTESGQEYGARDVRL